MTMSDHNQVFHLAAVERGVFFFHIDNGYWFDIKSADKIYTIK